MPIRPFPLPSRASINNASDSQMGIWDALQKKRALSHAVAGKETLASALDALEATRVSIVERATTNDSFARVDIVLGEFVKRSMWIEAFKYVIKLRQVIDQVVLRLRDRVDAEGGLDPEDATAIAQALNLRTTVLGTRRSMTGNMSGMRQATSGASFLPQTSQANMLASAGPSLTPGTRRMSSLTGVILRTSSTSDASHHFNDLSRHGSLPPIHPAGHDKSSENVSLSPAAPAPTSIESKYLDDDEIREIEMRGHLDKIRHLEATAREQEKRMEALETLAKQAEQQARDMAAQRNEVLTRLAGRTGDMSTISNRTALLEHRITSLQHDLAVQKSLTEEKEAALKAMNDKCVQLRNKLHVAQEAATQSKAQDGNLEHMVRKAEEQVMERDKMLKARNAAFAAARKNHQDQLQELAMHIALLEEGVRLRDSLLEQNGIQVPPAMPSKPLLTPEPSRDMEKEASTPTEDKDEKQGEEKDMARRQRENASKQASTSRNPPLAPTTAQQASSRRMASVYGSKSIAGPAKRPGPTKAAAGGRGAPLLPVLESPLDAPLKEESIKTFSIDAAGVHKMSSFEKGMPDKEEKKEDITTTSPSPSPHVASPPPVEEPSPSSHPPTPIPLVGL